MADDSLNYPLAPLGLLIQDSPPSHKPLCHWLDRLFWILFFIFLLNPRIHTIPSQSDVSASVRVAPATAHQTHSTPPLAQSDARVQAVRGVFLLATSLSSIRYLRAHPNGRRFNPLPNSARAARCISFLLFSAPPSLHLGPLVRCKPPPGFDELNGVVVVMTVNLFLYP